MIEISLQKIPNQEFSLVHGGVEYDIRLHLFRDICYASVKVGGETVVESARCISHQWIIPSRAYAKTGNFRFECSDRNDYPNYQNFGKLCFLRFYPNEEMADVQ